MRIAVTRPHSEALRTAEMLTALGHEAVVAPLFEIMALEAGERPDGDALVFSSLQGVAFFPPSWRDAFAERPVYCVGDRTAGQARQAGFSQVFSADGDIHALAGLITARQTRGSRLLHGAGRDVIADLARLLPDYHIIKRALYKAEQVAICPAALKEPIDGALHYSPRAARAFLALCPHHLAMITHYCLSAQVAEPLLAAGATCNIAKAPREDSLLALLQG